MQSFPLEILAFLGSKLEFKDILALATVNSEFRKIFLEKQVNKQLADYFFFPYDLTLTELKRYEDMPLRERLDKAALVGDKRIVEGVIELGADNYDQAMSTAAKKANEEIMDIMLKHGAEDYVWSLFSAAEGGHLEIVNKMVELGAFSSIKLYEYRELLSFAAQGGNLKIVELILEHRFSRNFNPEIYTNMMNIAAEKGYLDIVEKISELGARSYENAMARAAIGRHINIIYRLRELAKLNFVKLTALDYGDAMKYAAKYGHRNIIDLMLELGAENYEDAVYFAARGGHMDILDQMLELQYSLGRKILWLRYAVSREGWTYRNCKENVTLRCLRL